jgi:hypothetical protein
MSGFLRRRKPEPPVVVDRVEPVEVPVLTEVKRRIAQGDVAGAVRYAYPKVVEDLARAYRIPASPDRTHEEILSSAAIPETGHLPEFVRRLYGLYQPLRYEGPVPALDGEALFELVQSIYSARPMWQLYLEPRAAPPSGRPAPLGTAAGSTSGALGGSST